MSFNLYPFAAHDLRNTHGRRDDDADPAVCRMTMKRRVTCLRSDEVRFPRDAAFSSADHHRPIHPGRAARGKKVPDPPKE